MKEYTIWRRSHGTDKWTITTHTVNARTDKEAQSRVKRQFANCGFSAMSLVAVEKGKIP